MSVEQRLI